MRILTIHADFVEFEPLEKALRSAEEVAEGKGKRRVEECLVVFSAVEKADEENPSVIAELTAREAANVAETVKCNRIVLYPWVHLTSTPSKPDVALDVLKRCEKILKKKFEVERAPFGWYKSFDIKCKGHPLSELSREIKAEEIDEGKVHKLEIEEQMEEEEKKGEALAPVSESLKLEEQVKSRYYILTPKGEVFPADEFNYKQHPDLKKFADYEIRKVRAYAVEPPHIKLMKEHDIADFEPGSDSGNFRWYPNGRLIKKLLERTITKYCTDYGAMEVETPIMYDYEHPSLKKYLNRFPARQYIVKSEDKNFFLRFAACFGQFLITHDMVISYKDLPLKMFELTRYSFRREQSGELAGLKRVRALTMPDMHTLCGDVEQAKSEFKNQFLKCKEWMELLGLEFETGFRIEKEFFKKNKEWYLEMVRALDRPVMLEIFDVRYAYFITKFEFNFVDALDKASALSTVQIDVENAETYDLNYVDEKGKKRRPVLLHASISGSIERVVYALLEREAMNMKHGRRALLPIWLSPTQIRIVPISEKHAEFAEGVLNELRARRIRADIDDRGETLQKKVRDAEKEWVPFVAVIGDRELESKKLSVRVRTSGESREMDAGELAQIVEKENEGKPFEPLTLPDHLSRRALF
ncbi:MAG: threonine--tRNA ligase [Candidatus Micrarchaeota archaeon]